VNLTATVTMLTIEVMLRAMGGHIDKRWLAEPGWEGLPDVIINHVDTLARYPFIVQYKNQLRWEIEEAERFLNPEPELQLIGPCPEDDTPLTAVETDHETRCPTCGTTYGITAYRLNRILGALGDDGTPVRASEAVRRFNGAGLALTAKTVENWVKHEHIHPVAVDEHERRLFNLTDLYTRFATAYGQ
jgi:hypothetical protein